MGGTRGLCRTAPLPGAPFPCFETDGPLPSFRTVNTPREKVVSNCLSDLEAFEMSNPQLMSANLLSKKELQVRLFKMGANPRPGMSKAVSVYFRSNWSCI